MKLIFLLIFTFFTTIAISQFNCRKKECSITKHRNDLTLNSNIKPYSISWFSNKQLIHSEFSTIDTKTEIVTEYNFNNQRVVADSLKLFIRNSKQIQSMDTVFYFLDLNLYNVNEQKKQIERIDIPQNIIDTQNFCLTAKNRFFLDLNTNKNYFSGRSNGKNINYNSDLIRYDYKTLIKDTVLNSTLLPDLFVSKNPDTLLISCLNSKNIIVKNYMNIDTLKNFIDTFGTYFEYKYLSFFKNSLFLIKNNYHAQGSKTIDLLEYNFDSQKLNKLYSKISYFGWGYAPNTSINDGQKNLYYINVNSTDISNFIDPDIFNGTFNYYDFLRDSLFIIQFIDNDSIFCPIKISMDCNGDFMAFMNHRIMSQNQNPKTIALYNTLDYRRGIYRIRRTINNSLNIDTSQCSEYYAVAKFFDGDSLIIKYTNDTFRTDLIKNDTTCDNKIIIKLDDTSKYKYSIFNNKNLAYSKEYTSNSKNSILAIDTNNCVYVDSFQLTFYKKIDTSALNNLYFLNCNEPITIDILKDSFCNYFWNDTRDFNTKRVFYKAGKYYYTLFNYCNQIEQSINIVDSCIDPKFNLVNSFSPNGDGVNDFYEIPTSEEFQNFQWTIFNRFGEKMFESYDIKAKWDGKFKGSDQPVGSYLMFYKYSKDGIKFIKNSIVINIIK